MILTNFKSTEGYSEVWCWRGGCDNLFSYILDINICKCVSEIVTVLHSLALPPHHQKVMGLIPGGVSVGSLWVLQLGMSRWILVVTDGFWLCSKSHVFVSTVNWELQSELWGVDTSLLRIPNLYFYTDTQMSKHTGGSWLRHNFC